MTWMLFNLRLAYSTELGAALAYRGHARATKNPEYARRIREIEADERHHRAAVGAMLQRFDAAPWWVFEVFYWLVGTTIGLGCHVWGDWASAFGAAQFEFGGAGDYARCVRACEAAGHPELVEELAEFERQERAHRAYFLEMARECWPL